MAVRITLRQSLFMILANARKRYKKTIKLKVELTI